MTERYKIWLHIEKITGEGEDEEYEDVAPFPWSLGEFDTYEEAQERVQDLTSSPYAGYITVVNRVWNGEEGLSPVEAIRKGIKIDCWFIRKDGWTLGAPAEHINSAAALWADEWEEVYVVENGGPAMRFSYPEWSRIYSTSTLT